MSAGARRAVHGRGEGYTGAPGTASGARVRLGVHEWGQGASRSRGPHLQIVGLRVVVV